MARLNEPPVSTDSLETLRKKLLRQNRDLAKSNNVRALRIRELENDCACMLSENLELRSRILELEREAEDNDSQRIADHALAIKHKLEAQLTEWGTLLAGLGLEPPMKRHSPRIRKSAKQQRTSFSSVRPSPSQRRLRDIARDIEELGHISENKSYPRMSMNPEQILALRSEVNFAESAESPELGPPPMSQFIDEDPVKVDSPSRPRSKPAQEPSPDEPTTKEPTPKKPTPKEPTPKAPVLQDPTPKAKIEPLVDLPSPESDKLNDTPPSPEKNIDLSAKPQENKPQTLVLADNAAPPPIKAGSKRKLAARDDAENGKPHRITNENQPPRSVTDKQSIREKAGGKTLKELASMRKEARERSNIATKTRKPLAAKSTNDDISSPKKNNKPVIMDEVSAAKADLMRSKTSQDRSKPKSKNPPPVAITTMLEQEPNTPALTAVTCELGTPHGEHGLLSPSSPEPATSDEGPRGDTPPPADVNSNREPARLSRRSRTAVSYAEPNLRDKMRRPTKEMLDAVTGEGKFTRRSSQIEPLAPESIKIKRESDTEDSWKNLPLSKASSNEPEPGSIPASPLAGKSSSPQDIPSSAATDRRRRPSMVLKDTKVDLDNRKRGANEARRDAAPNDSASLSEVDVYEFETSSPRANEQTTVIEAKKPTHARKNSRRLSAAVPSDEGLAIRERGSSRRRSMML
ncbi:hypothetical protein G7046_g7234 [Stylonectria norvegica]|nr:hypothetical protein G7046_g7234 [Stylonectria norvegica]